MVKKQNQSADNILKLAMKKMRSTFWLVAGFSCFINLAMLVGPLYMLQVYDRVLTSQSLDTLVMLTVLAGTLLLLSALVEVARSRMLVRAGAGLDADLGAPLFSASLGTQFGHAGIDQTSASQPLRDLESVRGFLTGAGLLALFDAPWTPVYLLVIFLLHPVLGIIATIGALVIFLLALINEFMTRKALAKAGGAQRGSNQFVDQVSRNSEAVLAMGMLGALRKRWRGGHDTGIAWQAIASDRAGLLKAAAKFVRLGLQIGILGIGAYLAINQALSPGAMVAASIIMGRALAPVESAIGHWRGVISARSAYGRLVEFFATYHDQTGRTSLPAPKGRLDVDIVALRPQEGVAPILQFINFTLEPGEALGLIGASGAGKSSLARLLAGVWTPTLGSVRLDGADISDWPREDLGRHMGFMPQNVELLSGTVAENIARFTIADSDEIIEAAQIAGAHDLILKLPQGYDTTIGEGGHVLSGGQRQYIALARAIFGDARLIILDEPNAHLDGDGELALRHAMDHLKGQGRTLIVISHRPSVLAVVDKILILRDGRVQAYGARDDVLGAQVQLPSTPGQEKQVLPAGIDHVPNGHNVPDGHNVPNGQGAGNTASGLAGPGVH